MNRSEYLAMKWLHGIARWFADELGVCGTLHEVMVVTRIDEYKPSEKSPTLCTIQQLYLEAVLGD